jgi:hypothetical protein
MRVDEFLHLSSPGLEECELIGDAHVARSGEDESADLVSDPALSLDWPISDALVPGDDDEIGAACNFEPGLVGRASGYLPKVGMAGVEDAVEDLCELTCEQEVVLIDEPAPRVHAA